MGLGTLIVGLGQIGMEYDLDQDPASYVFSHARAFSQRPTFSIVAGVDPVLSRRQTFTQRYQSPAYTDVEDALQCHQPAVVVIATPTALHAETLRKVLRESVPKAVLCEKPLAYDIDDARDMVEMCEKQGVALYVNYMRRADPATIEIKRRIDSGAIETPVKGVVWYTKGLLNNGSHFLNLLEYWLGPVRRSDILERGSRWNEADPEPDVRIVFERGTVTFLAADKDAFAHNTIELLTVNGRLYYGRGGNLISWQAALSDAHFHGYKTLAGDVETIPSGMGRYQWYVASELENAIAGQQHCLSSGADALATLETIHAIVRTI